MNRDIHGIVPVIPMPFRDDESIDEPVLRRVIDFVVSQGVSALCLPAYGSEFYKLSEVERARVIEIAIDQTRGRCLVVAQANHPSACHAGELARNYEKLGADVISFAIPRQFASTDADVIAYCGGIAGAVGCPILIQDFNPGGPTMSPQVIGELNRQHAHIRYVKLEEPMIIDKIHKTRAEVGGRVGILGGWGGYYMLESMSAGAIGFMPGAAICDILSRVFHANEDGAGEEAYRLFSEVLPLIAFSLQDFEMFLHMEKRLLVRRGVFTSQKCRAMTRTFSEQVSRHIDWLLDRVMAILQQENMAAGGS